MKAKQSFRDFIRRSKNLNRFRFLSLATILLMPFLGQLVNGDFIFGSAGILWAFVAVLLAILTTNTRGARRWFIAFIGLLLISVLLEPIVSSAGSLTEGEIVFGLVFVMVGVTSFVFLFSTYMLSEKNLAYRLLDIESEKSENLLLNVLPSEIVPRLKEGEETIAERFENASVLFADLVGSTPLTSALDPVAITELLNQIFSQFDLVSEKYGLSDFGNSHRNKHESARLLAPGVECDGAVPGRSLACLSSPLVLVRQVRARCLRPRGLPVLELQAQVTARTGRHGLGRHRPGTGQARSSHLLSKHKQPLGCCHKGHLYY